MVARVLKLDCTEVVHPCPEVVMYRSGPTPRKSACSVFSKSAPDDSITTGMNLYVHGRQPTVLELLCFSLGSDGFDTSDCTIEMTRGERVRAGNGQNPPDIISPY